MAAALGLLASAGCRTRLWELPDLAHEEQKVKTACRQEEPTRKVDLLFMIDNSTSMDAMQSELKKRFPRFIQVLRALEAGGTSMDLHLGVVTSDYGAGSSGWGNCETSPGGQRGRLQAIGQFAAAGCQPPVGANFVRYTLAPGADGPANLPPGQSLEETFTCMASVGARGCGEEHQLESVRAALQDPIPENAGFLRDDALLAVVFVTNEDDCSAPTGSDLFGIETTAKYGSNLSYRCTRYGVMCGDPPAQPPYDSSHGELNMCVAAPNPGGTGPGKLFDIGRYLDVFTHARSQGGLKFDPADVLLVAIDAPEKPFEVILANPLTGNDGDPYEQCPRLSESGNPPCIPTLQHSCRNADDPNFFGDPAVRLNQVVSAAANHAIASICNNDFTSALQNLAGLIESQLGACCLPEALPPDPRGEAGSFVADCTVEQVTRHEDGSTTVTALPECARDGAFPCWQLRQKDTCGALSPQGIGISVEWNGIPPPPHTTINAACTGLPH